MAVSRGRIAALATAEEIDEECAEVAFLVADQDRGRGLGSLLLEHLAALGRRYGVRRFEADVLEENYGMLRVFRRAGFAATRRTEEGEVAFVLRTDASQEAVDAADRREWRAEALSLRPLLYPRSVAVVGVRRSAGGFGFGVLDAIRSSAYDGPLHVVHPEAAEIDGLAAVRSLAAIGEPVDLVVIAVPGDAVAGVLSDAGAAGAGSVCVVSSGLRRPHRRHRRAPGDRPGAQRADRRAELAGAARERSRRSASTRRCSTRCPSPAGSVWCRSRAAWDSRCSTWPATSGSVCTPSCRSATRSTCRATTCSARGWTTSG